MDLLPIQLFATVTPAVEWERCKHWIEAALSHSPHVETIEDVERYLADGSYQFWPGKNSAAITTIDTYARKKVLTVVHGGGNLHELMEEMEPSFCTFARREGCHMIWGTGREGWKRPSEKHGYRLGFIVMVKDLIQ